MPLVNCVLHGDGDEAGSKVSFFAPAPVTLASLHRLFPYEGTFHFRLRLDGARHLGLKAPAPGDPCYVWLDLTEALCGEFASALSGESVEVQALFLALPEQPVDGTAQYLAHYDDVHDEVCQLDQRPDRYPVVGAKKGKDGRGGSDSGSGSGSGVVRQTADVLKFISRGARDGLKQGVSAVKQQQQSLGASLMGFTKSVFNGLQKTADITAVAEDNLTQLSDDASTAFNVKNSVHVSVLLNLWEVLFPQGGPYQRTSDTWRTAGFQKPDPVLDLKATGILALRAMTYLCHKFPVKAQAMLKKNQANVKVRRKPPTTKAPALHHISSHPHPDHLLLTNRPTTRSPSSASTSPCSSSTCWRCGSKSTSRPTPGTGRRSKTTRRFSSCFASRSCTWTTSGRRKGPCGRTLAASSGR